MAIAYDLVKKYLDVGLSVLPARRNGHHKCVALRHWKPYQSQLPTESELRTWFANDHQAICLVGGAISGNLEMLDFDLGGEAFEAWRTLIVETAPRLFDRLVIERTPSGGCHVVYRCESPVCGNMKLAQRNQNVPGSDPIILAGKEFRPRQTQGVWSILLTLIESRGEGGMFLCAPSDGYCLTQGDLTILPVISSEEREMLLSAAWSLNEHVPDSIPVSGRNASFDQLRPGDDYDKRGDVRAVLKRHGWTLVRAGENEYWRRPGRTDGWSASLRNGMFYVFSSNAAPFEPDRAYTSFTVYALLEHAGDFTAAASALRTEGYGGDADVDLSRFMSCRAIGERNHHPPPVDPGAIPDDLLRIPGFISEVMDHCMATAPYPNIPLAFCGAVALQAVLAGRKVRDSGDNRTNLYILALANSAVGKDWPRKVNAFIMHHIGMSSLLGEKFASGEGIQDALHITPSMLFQTDEIDGLLQSINKARDARHENIMSTLLTMYSAANSIYPMRRKAGKESPGVIDQPCLVVYGAAIPGHYYQALSERMLTNGFLARMLIVESGVRSKGQDPGMIAPSASIINTARWWCDFLPTSGNLERWHPNPKVVEADNEARTLWTQSRHLAETEYGLAEAGSDAVGMTVWGRVPEHIRKLALLHAVSANHRSPRIDAESVRWATTFVLHQTRRMLFMANTYVAENPFHGECLKLLRKLRESPAQEMQRQHLLRAMRCKATDFDQIIFTLLQQEDIIPISIFTKTRNAIGYRLSEKNIN